MSINTPVIDFHSHLGRWERFGVDDESTRYIRLMDEAGIDQTLVNCIFHGSAKRSNDITFEFVNKNPDRFLSVAFVTPYYPEECIPELERCFDQLDMKFLKIYPDYFGKPNDDVAYFPIYEFLNDRSLSVMAHAKYPFDKPDLNLTNRYTQLAERFPNVKWVLAHAGGGGDDEVEAAKAVPSVYLETCGSGARYNGVKNSVEGAGADRVLFGTDAPLLDQRHQIAKVTTADISEDAKKRVLGLNAIELLGLDIR